MQSQQADGLKDFIASLDLRKTMKQADKLEDAMKDFIPCKALTDYAPHLLDACQDTLEWMQDLEDEHNISNTALLVKLIKVIDNAQNVETP